MSPVYGAYPGLTSDRIAEFEITPVNIINSKAEEEIVFTCNTEAYDPRFGIVYVPGSKYYASNSSRGGVDDDYVSVSSSGYASAYTPITIYRRKKQ